MEKNTKMLILLPIFSLILSGVAWGEIIGNYKGVSEFCSDGTVYQGDTDVMTSSRTDAALNMIFEPGNLVTMSTFITSAPEQSGSYKIKYTIDKNGIMTPGEVLEVNFPQNLKMTKKFIENMLAHAPVGKISTNGVQLIVSNPGFNGNGRCKKPAFVINVYEKQN